MSWKFGINAWAFGGGTAVEQAKQAAKLGYDSIELSVGPDEEINFNLSDEQLKAIGKQVREQGVEISSIASGVFWGVPPTSNDPAVRKTATGYLQQMVRCAHFLGTDHLLFVPGAVCPPFIPGAPVIDYLEAVKRAAAAISTALKACEKYRVTICVENVWNRMFTSAVEFRDFIDSFESKHVKAYFDIGNCVIYGFPEHWIRILGKRRLGRIHVKDFRNRWLDDGTKDPAGLAARDAARALAKGSNWAGAYCFCNIGDGDVNFPEVMKALKHVGYTGYLTAEILPPYKEAPQDGIKQMKKVFKG
ncbi:MAG: sugar phosphate isomerase/epimerase family protein [Rhodanobacteraceae bacterium]